MGPIIRICSTAALALIAAHPLAAHARADRTSGLGYYVKARVADRDQEGAVARANYSAALTLAPDAVGVAFRAYRAAVEGGDYALALRAAQALDRIDIVPPDAQLMLFVAAVRERDWNGARRRLDRIGDERGFGFLEPLLADWLSFGSGEGGRRPGREAATAYTAESAALLQIARGATAEGSTTIRTLWTTDPDRATTLRLAAAATLGRKRDRSVALALLGGDDPARASARRLVAAGRRLPGAVDTPTRGTAFVLARMAGDLLAGNTPRSALVLARMANFADPTSPQAMLTAARALIAVGQPRLALGLLTTRDFGDPYRPAIQTLSVDALQAAGDAEGALALAEKTGSDPARLGDIEMRRDRPAAAALHYRAALAAQVEGDRDWTLLLATANALDAAGDWSAARPLLETALTRAPDEPRLLNQMGYALADRGEELPRALALLERANAARPDDPAIVDSLGWAYFRLGDYRQAITFLERARVLDAANAEIGGHLGDAYWRAGRRIEARYAWSAARETADVTAALALSGRIANGLP